MTPKKNIVLTIEHKDHSTTTLTNGNGDTFTYNPHIHEGLNDFLSLAKLKNNIYILESEHNRLVENLKSEVKNKVDEIHNLLNEMDKLKEKIKSLEGDIEELELNNNNY